MKAGPLADRCPRVTAYICCIGAEKAGTTWLTSRLDAHSACHIAPNKELSYWNAVDLGRSGPAWIAESRARVRRAWLDLLLSPLRPGSRGRRAWRLRRSRMQLAYASRPGVEAYLDMLTDGWNGEPVVGEATPAYALLGSGTFARIAALHPRTRFIFIMRDPIDRLWAGVRHRTRFAPRGAAMAQAQAAFAAAATAPDSRHLRLSDYRTTIEALEAAVPAGAILYLFAEHLWAGHGWDRVNAFAGLPGALPDSGDRLSGQGRRQPPAGAALDAARAALDPTYTYVADRFGDAVPANWRL